MACGQRRSVQGDQGECRTNGRRKYDTNIALFPAGNLKHGAERAGVREPAKGALVSRVLHSPARHRTCAKYSAHEFTAAVAPE
jgi:hypothetical protein